MNKPFDLKAALSGEPVVDSFGNVYKFYSYTLYDDGSHRIKFTNSKENFVGADLDGNVLLSDDSLTMAPKKVKKTVYINAVPNSSGGVNTYPYESANQAKAVAAFGGKYAAIAVPIEIEVEE